PDAVVLDRRDWGNVCGTLKQVQDGNDVVAEGADRAWTALQSHLPDALRTFGEISRIETDEIGDVNYAQERIRLRLKNLDLAGECTGPEVDQLNQETAALQSRYTQIEARLNELKKHQTESFLMFAADGQEKV